MTRLFLYPLLMLLWASASSETIYKWTDDQGRVHYGEKNEAPKSSTSITVPDRPPSTEAPSNAPRSNTSGQDTARVTPTEPSNLQRCLAMARAMVDNKDQTPQLIPARAKELMSLCPDTAFECTSSTTHPERNSCEAVPRQPNGQLVRNRTYN